MRYFQQLDTITRDETTDSLIVSCKDDPECRVTLWLGRAGLYVDLSANDGPLELALRLRQHVLVTALSELHPTPRLSVMRMIGTGHANLELGLSTGGELLVRVMIIADATGHFAMNLTLSSGARAGLFAWLGVQNPAF